MTPSSNADRAGLDKMSGPWLDGFLSYVKHDGASHYYLAHTDKITWATGYEDFWVTVSALTQSRSQPIQC